MQPTREPPPLARPLAALAIAAAVALAASPAARAGEAKPDPSEVPELMARLRKDDYEASRVIDRVVALGPAAVPALLEAVKDPEPRVRYWSAAALARTRDERGFRPLANLAAGDPDPTVRKVAVWHLRHYLAKHADEVWALVEKALADPHPAVRLWAMKVIEDRGHRESLPRLEALLAHKDPATRHDALVRVILMSPARAVEIAGRALARDPDPQVRAAAMRALTRLDPPPVEALEVMITGLEDAHVEVRKVALTLLAKGAGHVLGYDPDAPDEVRAAAVGRWRDWYARKRDRLAWDDARRLFVESDKDRTAPPGMPK
jgi:HEAT repeat protein